MRRSTKKKVIPLALALALALIGAALAVPMISVSVQQIGAGGPTPVLNPISSAAFKWNLNSTDPDKLVSLDVTIGLNNTVSSNLTSGTIYIKFYNGTNFVGKYTYTLSSTNYIDTNNNVISISASYLQSILGASSTTLEAILPKFDRIAVVYQGSSS